MKNHKFRIDHFALKAKKENFLTRAVYKLISIDKTFKLFESNTSVLDLGAAPGSWIQYSSQRIGKNGIIIAIDLLPINIEFNNLYTIQNDIFEWDYLSQLSQLKNNNNFPENLDCINYGFHNIISDMAPNLTGNKLIDNENSYNLWKQTLTISKMLGRYNSNLVIKGFQSEELKIFLNEMRSSFKFVKTHIPRATRNSSNEIYCVGKQLKNKKPYFDINHNQNDIENPEFQKLFNLWDYIKMRQDQENDKEIKNIINKKSDIKIDIAKSRLLSKLS